MASRQQFQRLESFLDDGETTIDSYSTDDEVGVLTDRRVVQLATTGRDETTTVVNTTYLDRIGGAKIEHKTTPGVDQETVVSGIAALFLALVSIALLGVVDGGGLTGVLVVVGLSVGLIGLVLLIEAYHTPDGSVRIVLQAADGDAVWQTRLDEGQLEFAETLSKTVSNAHTPANSVTRTVGT
ncbi:hypothetical protein CV102_19365 [Natronococcus pandeyae]|uniref:Uncharacterized protein n=1 Tax=Natronococcus pandeyae TaxID=2055836 RepID=A0A8J8TNQ6_9EURY|nr:hypothetical protein [Natronococcus pandeyae]TYL36921.1 hypothetical protein CV102_19365 [Natronococcus pandeyae]